MFAQWGGTCWGVVGFAKGSLGGLCCEHCEVDAQFQGYGSDGVGFGVSVVRMRKSVASSLGFGVWGFSWVISKVRGYDVCRYVGLRVNKVVFTL